MTVFVKSLTTMLVTASLSVPAWAGNAVAIESVNLSNEGFTQSSATTSAVRTEQLNNKYPENTGGTPRVPTQNDCMSCD